MNPHILYIANAFYIGAILLAIPSTAALIFYAVFRFQLWMTPSHPASAPLKNPDAILMIIVGMARGFGAIANGIGTAGKVVFGWIAIVSGIALLVALCLYLTARGLMAHQPWARGMAAVMMFGLLLVSLVSMVSVGSRRKLMSLVFFVGSIYALRGLWLGYGS